MSETVEQYEARKARNQAEWERRQCTSKAVFVSRREARASLHRSSKGKMNCGRLDAYRCKVCGRWHVGTKRNSPKVRVEGLER